MKFNLHMKRDAHKPSFHLWKDGTSTYMNPARDWTIGIGIAIVGLVLGLGLVGFDFYAQYHAPGVTVPVQSNGNLYNEKTVREYAKLYDDREAEFKRLRSSETIPMETAPSAATTSENPLADH